MSKITLSPAEELQFISNVQAKKGSADRDFAKLLKAHEGLIDNTAKKFPKLYKYWKDDLIQEGSVAFLEAVSKFNPASGNRLSTFAQKVIYSRIVDFTRKVSKYELSVDILTEPDTDDTPNAGCVQNIPQYDDQVTRTIASIDFSVPTLTRTFEELRFTERDREVFELYHSEGYGLKDLALKMDLSVSMVHKIVTRSKNKLRTHFNSLGYRYLN